MPIKTVWIFLMLSQPILSFSQFTFVENSQDRGILFQQINGSKEKEYIVEAKGAGVAVADVNNDGWDDIYLVNGAYLRDVTDVPKPRHQLFLNLGNGKFKDITDASGLGDTGFGTGAYFADVDNDGDLDCYLTNYGPNQLYKNDGKGRFTPVPNAGGAQNPGWSTGAAFADINGDGFLDLYVGNYAIFSPEIAEKKGKLAPLQGYMSFIGPSAYQPAEDNLFLNNGDGTFLDVTKERGINASGPGRAFTATFSDLDNDGDLDIYVADDTTCNHLYENNGKGFFEEISLLAGVGLSEAGEEQGSMGVAIRDIDGDLDLDIIVANYQDEYNILYRNDGGMHFTDASFVNGVGQGTVPLVTFGALLEDFDNDGWPDLTVTNGHVYPLADKIPMLHGYAQQALFYHNENQGHFVNVSDKVGPITGMKSVARGSAAADFDHDGDVDIIVNNLDSTPLFLENCTQPLRNWLQVMVQDERGMPAYGAQLLVETPLGKQIAELHSSDSFLSQSSAYLHFGLGKADKVNSLQVRFPNGAKQELRDVKVNQRMVVRMKKG